MDLTKIGELMKNTVLNDPSKFASFKSSLGLFPSIILYLVLKVKNKSARKVTKIGAPTNPCKVNPVITNHSSYGKLNNNDGPSGMHFRVIKASEIMIYNL